MQKLGIRLKERISRSAFFFGAVLFHLVLFLMLVGYVVWPHQPEEKVPGFDPVSAQQIPKPPPSHTDSTTANDAPSGPPIIQTSIPDGGFAKNPIPTPSIDVKPNTDPGHVMSNGPGINLPAPQPTNRSTSPVDLHLVQQAHEHWHPGNNPKFVIPLYLAKYADGDWDCNAYLHDGQLVSGCLPNLMAKVKEWSNGEISGRDLKVVDLASPTILSDPPPFIFFTGHKDFHLTQAEVDNLAKYLQMGGAIWGDSAFAGDGSRFDVAFHREMKRVLPDADLNFEPLSTDDDVFKKSRFALDELPRGMNQRADQIECIKLAGKLAILYTPNDYSDMMTMLLLPGRNDKEAQMDRWNHWEPQHPLFTPGFFVGHSKTFFRNYEPGSSMATFKLSMNVLFRLLHQYDDDTLLTP